MQPTVCCRKSVQKALCEGGKGKGERVERVERMERVAEMGDGCCCLLCAHLVALWRHRSLSLGSAANEHY